MQGLSEHERYKPYNARTIRDTPYWHKLTPALQEAMTVVARVMPFRTNEYVLGTLIDWNNIPDDPIFRMTFPHKDMLLAEDYASLKQLIEQDDAAAIKRRIEAIWLRMNPHPAGQLTHNGVTLDGKVLPGIQHKYRETVLFFPGAGQTCHAYCTFCFRWAQFIGEEELKFNARESQELVSYLKVAHRSHGRADYRRRPDDHEHPLAGRVHRTAAGSAAPQEHPHRHQVGGVLAAAVCQRQGCARAAGAVSADRRGAGKTSRSWATTTTRWRSARPSPGRPSSAFAPRARPCACRRR